ncbi:hypothetical protein D3C80_1571330 [compost metagenome]
MFKEVIQSDNHRLTMHRGINITKLLHLLTETINDVNVVFLVVIFQPLAYFFTEPFITFINVIFGVFVICRVIMKICFCELTKMKKSRTEEIDNIGVAKFSI